MAEVIYSAYSVNTQSSLKLNNFTFGNGFKNILFVTKSKRMNGIVENTLMKKKHNQHK